MTNHSFGRRSLGVVSAAFALCATTWIPLAVAQDLDFNIDPKTVRCGDYSQIEPIVWYGDDPRMTLEQMAAYCAPILWFSPDEPLLHGASGKDIRTPEPFPFEDPAMTPVVYYRVRNILERGDARSPAYEPVEGDRGKSVINLASAVGVDLDFFFYYPSEAGLGGHKHDVEYAEFQALVWRRDSCASAPYHLLITKVIGKAHGLQWYDNTLGVDEYTRFPMTLLVEEGKHATCTDKNADGYYSPGYDVNRRVNDAWGVRDLIRSGSLLTGSYQSWMTKVRRPEDRVFPPLPEDSPLRGKLVEDGVYAPEHAVYELRPFPSAEDAAHDLVHFIADKGDPDWPAIVQTGTTKEFWRWVGSEPFVKSLSIAAYTDGEFGVSGVFPFFIVKNLEDPMGGGYVLHRVIFKDKKLRDFSWMLLYTASASRWIDKYVAAGVESDKFDLPAGSPTATDSKTDFVLEAGLKFRVNLDHTPFRFMTVATDFWGLRAGVKNYGAFKIDHMRYVLEFGAGTW